MKKRPKVIKKEYILSNLIFIKYSTHREDETNIEKNETASKVTATWLRPKSAFLGTKLKIMMYK